MRYLQNEEENFHRNRELRIAKRVMRDQSDPFHLPDSRFRELFRLNKDLVANIFAELVPHMQDNIRNTKIVKQTRILIALRFFSTGAYQRSIGEEYLLAVSQQTTSRCISEVSELIVRIFSNQWIRFPLDQVERTNIKRGFMDKAGFPGIIGCIDATHVAMIAPREDEHLFVNRKGFHSKNVQIICSPNLEITSINARYPGSTNDAFIWRASRIHDILENNYTAGNKFCNLLIYFFYDCYLIYFNRLKPINYLVNILFCFR